MSKVLKTSVAVALFCIFVLTGGCSNKASQSKLLNEVIQPNKLSDIAAKMKDDKQLSKDEIDLFSLALIRLSETPDSLKGKTVGQIIESQKDVNRNQSITNMVFTASRVEMVSALTIKPTRKINIEKDTINADGVEFTMKNNTDKDITSIIGSIRIVNNQNQLIKLRPINYTNISFKAGAQVTQSEVWPHDSKNEYDELLRKIPDLNYIWVPETIIFADGKKLTVAQPQAQK